MFLYKIFSNYIEFSCFNTRFDVLTYFRKSVGNQLRTFAHLFDLSITLQVNHIRLFFGL